MKKALVALALALVGSAAQAAVVAVDLDNNHVFDAFLDAENGLLWTNGTAFEQSGMSYADALAAVDASTIEGVTTWRLPTMNEFLSLYATQGTSYLNSAPYMTRDPLTLGSHAYWTTDVYVSSDPAYKDFRKAFVANISSAPGDQIYGYSKAASLGVWAVAAVPEPETYAMLLSGLACIGLIARRRKTTGVCSERYLHQMNRGTSGRLSRWSAGLDLV
jgi:hypothetical protein